MKKIINIIINVKTFAAMIFIGEIILFMLAKFILGVYEVSFITIISLFLLALCISILIYLFESEFVNKKIERRLVVIIQYLLVVAVSFAFNSIFDYFVVSGIQYFYLLLFISFCYWGGTLGFYIVSKLQMNVLNIKLTQYHSK